MDEWLHQCYKQCVVIIYQCPNFNGSFITTQHIEAETNGRHFPDDIFKSIFLNENVLISIKISLKFVPKGQISNIPALV